MIEAYESGDAYLGFAKLAGMVPPHATKASHPEERERAKACCHGLNYGMGEHGLARRVGGLLLAHELVGSYQRTFRKYPPWREAVIDDAICSRKIVSALGWPQHIRPPINPRSIGNFPMQAAGADMLRLACCYAAEKGAPICATVHDAIAFECDERELDAVTNVVTKSMQAASRVVLSGFELRVDKKVVRYPDRFVDGRGAAMWNTVMDALNGLTDAKEVEQ